jgi:trigger factor
LTEALIITTVPGADHQVELTIQFGPERTEKALQRAARQVSQHARIPGFRPGKAPNATVLRLFGRRAVLSEILEDLGDEAVREALAETKIEMYGQPKLSDVEVDPPTFKLTVPLLPTAALGEYAGIRLDAPQVTVTEADVDTLLERESQEHATPQPVDRPAAIGDTVTVDIRGAVGETVIMDNQDWSLSLRAEGGWLPGFDDAFVGLSAGETKTFTLTYPDDATSRFRGQEATFETTVKEVQAKIPRVLDDDFARSLGDYTDLADLRAKVLAELTQRRTSEAETGFQNAMVEALVATGSFAYPPAAVDDTVKDLIHDLEHRVSSLGYSLTDYFRLQGRKQEDYEREIRPLAERRLKGQLALRELAKREGIKATDDEVQARIAQMVEATAEAERDELRKLLSSEAGLFSMRQDVVTGKALARLRAIVTGQPTSEPEPQGERAAEAKALEPEA